MLARRFNCAHTPLADTGFTRASRRELTTKNNVIKRMAYGFRDDTYFFLKIRAAFSGIPR